MCFTEVFYNWARRPSAEDDMQLAQIVLDAGACSEVRRQPVNCRDSEATHVMRGPGSGKFFPRRCPGEEASCTTAACVEHVFSDTSQLVK